ncbi:hypothetical protein PG994_003392 [Apiospora phragmitis]|uniref:Ribosome assembly protein 3 n=1 Tax=Apiospora phragmitis TaxID=2905665 RepID=A0ABR1VY04_9PEZI
MAPKEEASSEFTSFYLQQATKELAEDLDKARTADDFKGDALSMLIKALQQGTALFTPAEQKRIAPPLAKEDGAKKARTDSAAGAAEEADESSDDESDTTSSGGSSTSSSGEEDAEAVDAKTSSDSSSEASSSSSDED